MVSALVAVCLCSVWLGSAIPVHAGLADWIPRRRVAPAVGSIAPDFELRRLRSDETLRLSSLRERPVALVFGSYT